LTLPHVERLLGSLQGKTVVTSDHGNMIGESSHPVSITEYGHPGETYTPELVTVPWVVHVQGDRKRVISESPTTTEQDEMNTSEHIENRIKHLGYKQ